MTLPRNVTTKRSRASKSKQSKGVKKLTMSPVLMNRVDDIIRTTGSALKADTGAYERHIQQHRLLPYTDSTGQTYTKATFDNISRLDAELLIHLASQLTACQRGMPFCLADEEVMKGFMAAPDKVEYGLALSCIKYDIVMTKVPTRSALEMHWMDGNVHKSMCIYRESQAQHLGLPTCDHVIHYFEGNRSGHSAKFLDTPTETYYYTYTELNLK